MFSTIIRGDPRCPPLIFFHGLFGSKEDWEEIISLLEHTYYCVAIDLPGHGATPYCADIPSELKKIVTSNAVLIGYSMGGRIALQLGAKARAVIAISAHPGLKTPEEREVRRAIDQAWSEKMLTLPLDTFFNEWYAQPVFASLHQNKPLLQKLIAKRMKNDPQAISRVIDQMTPAKQPCIEEFPKDTLLLHGEEDWKYRELYCTLGPQVLVRTVPKCGHTCLSENPIACAEKIIDYLKEIYVNTH